MANKIGIRKGARKASEAPKQAESKASAESSPAVKQEHQRGKSDAGIAEAVYRQLEEDYGKRFLGWVLAAHWSGPRDVPLSEIDTSNRHKWAASEDDKHVNDFLKAAKQGSVKPIILVNEPNNDKMMIVDGHHRYLAAEKAGVPVRAYVAVVGGVGGDWEKMHDKQDSHGGIESKQESNQK